MVKFVVVGKDIHLKDRKLIEIEYVGLVICYKLTQT